MPRIRTLKPEFWLSDDICALTIAARCLYIGLFQHADREGRLEWKPGAIKRAVLPTDDVDIHALFAELTGRGLVVTYGDGLAWIPTFTKHQRINAREPASKLPPPPSSSSHVHARARTCGREGGGREGEGREMEREMEGRGRAHPLPENWKPDEEDLAWAKSARPDLTPSMLDEQTGRFANHARAKDRRLVAWGPAWRNWIGEARRAEAAGGPRPPSSFAAPSSTLEQDSHDQWRARLRGYRPGRFWHGDWGPRPESGRSIAPSEILADWEASIADWEAAHCTEVPHAHAPPAPAHPGND